MDGARDQSGGTIVGAAVDVSGQRQQLDRDAASAVLVDTASDIEVSSLDLAELIVQSAATKLS